MVVTDGIEDWQIETIHDKGDVEYYSLKQDAPSHPHISIYLEKAGGLMYAFFNGTSWEIETVDSVGEAGLYTSLALDSAGFPHISDFDDANDTVEYAWKGEPACGIYPPVILLCQ